MQVWATLRRQNRNRERKREIVRERDRYRSAPEFQHLVLCAGITPSSGSGFMEVEADDCVTMVQLATQKCLEKEALCNEFYLQLIKQTTDQPGSYLASELL